MTGNRRRDLIRRLAAPFRRLGGWIIAAPRRHKPSQFRLWLTRLIAILFALWLITYGPGTVIMPYKAGFRSVTRDDTSIYYPKAMSDDQINQLLVNVELARAKACEFWGELPAGVNRKVDIYVCSSKSRYKQMSLAAGGNACEMGSRIILYPAGIGEQNLSGITGHEISHVYLKRHLGYITSFKVPRWLDEGIATYLGTPSWATQEMLIRYLAGMSPPRIVSATCLTSLLQWSGTFDNLNSVGLQYAYVRSLTEYLIKNNGSAKMKDYIHRLSYTGNADEVFALVYGIKLEQMEKNWLGESLSSGSVPPNTTMIQGVIRPTAAIMHYARYAFILVCLLWIVRQCCRGVRLFWSQAQQIPLIRKQTADSND
jgi:hypothetical protein